MVRPLSWGSLDDARTLAASFFDKEHSLSYFGTLTSIICSDLVYFPELLGPLLRTLLHITSQPFTCPPGSISEHHTTPTVFISYKIRSLAKETTFWTAFGLWFQFSPVLAKDPSKTTSAEWHRFGVDFDDTTFLFVGHRRPESYSWKVPVIDEDLLGGVGANGTDTRKGDDTFENLLLMSLEQD